MLSCIASCCLVQLTTTCYCWIVCLLLWYWSYFLKFVQVLGRNCPVNMPFLRSYTTSYIPRYNSFEIPLNLQSYVEEVQIPECGTLCIQVSSVWLLFIILSGSLKCFVWHIIYFNNLQKSWEHSNSFFFLV